MVLPKSCYAKAGHEYWHLFCGRKRHIHSFMVQFDHEPCWTSVRQMLPQDTMRSHFISSPNTNPPKHKKHQKKKARDIACYAGNRVKLPFVKPVKSKLLGNECIISEYLAFNGGHLDDRLKAVHEVQKWFFRPLTDIFNSSHKHMARHPCARL